MAQPNTENRPPALPPALDAMTVLVAAVIVHDRETDRVVLLQRGPGNKFAPGRWDLPVGKSEPGEPITETAVRELREETGLIVRADDLRLAQVVHGAWGVEAPNGFLTVVFATHQWAGEPENRELAKHTQVRWVDTVDLPEEFVPTSATALRHYLSGGPQISLRGWAS
ncbi:NUDIX domain-containing protein [Streptomyces sp. NBC_01410]|uniref:NUDIX domain-containing protein n=1 Tax=Streptomyces sp. NBC_01410 TaxID=2903856 RepID=UPI0032529FCE